MTLSDPAGVQKRLDEIDHELAIRQNAWEAAAKAWFKKLGTITKERAIAYRKASGGPTDKREAANEEFGDAGSLEQAEYEALRAVVKVLEMRATIGMSILKSQGRA